MLMSADLETFKRKFAPGSDAVQRELETTKEKCDEVLVEIGQTEQELGRLQGFNSKHKVDVMEEEIGKLEEELAKAEKARKKA